MPELDIGPLIGTTTRISRMIIWLASFNVYPFFIQLHPPKYTFFLLLIASVAIAVIISDTIGIILSGIYLCHTSRAGEVDRWARLAEFKFPWLTMARSFLKMYSKRCKK